MRLSLFYYVAFAFFSHFLIASESPCYLTCSKFAEFLNCNTTSDFLHCYDEKMGADGLIIRKGTPGHYSYVVAKRDKPLYYINLPSAKYYAEWEKISLKEIVTISGIDEDLKINRTGLWLTAPIEGSFGYHLSSPVKEWAALGIMAVLLGGGAVGYYCIDQPCLARREAARHRPLEGEENNDLLTRSTSSSRETSPKKDQQRTILTAKETENIATLLETVKKESREKSTPISCLARDAAPNKFLLRYSREQKFNKLVRADLKKQEGDEKLQTAQIIQKINSQSGKRTACFNYLCSFIPGRFSLRSTTAIARALNDERPLTPLQMKEISKEVGKASITLAIARAENREGGGPLKNPDAIEIQKKYPYISSSAAVKAAADSVYGSTSPLRYQDRDVEAAVLLQNSADQIEPAQIEEIVSLINHTKQQSLFSYNKKDFFCKKIKQGKVTPATMQLLSQLCASSSEEFNLPDNSWIAGFIVNNKPTTFLQVSQEVKKQLRRQTR